jgi:hypothetical protein
LYLISRRQGKHEKEHAMNQEKIELRVLNPRGEIETKSASFPSPRVADLSGKKIGLYSNMKQGMDNFYIVFEELLKEKYPEATTMKISGAFLIRDEDAGAMAEETDAFVYGVGD